MPDGTHYTAVVEIVHTQVKSIAAGRATGQESKEREKREVARFVVRSDSINDLTTQVQAHLALVKDYN